MERLSPRIRSLVRQANKVAESGKRSAATKLYRQVLEEAPETVEAWVGLSTVLRTQDEKEAALDRALELDPDNANAKRELAILHGEIPEEPDNDDENDISETTTASEQGETSDLVAVLPPAATDTSNELLSQETKASEDVSDAAAVGAATGRGDGDGTYGVKDLDGVEKSSEVEEVDLVNAEDHSDEDGHELEYVSEVLFCANHPKRETHLRCNRCGKPICTSCAQRTPVGYRCPECIREHEDAFFNATPLDYLIAVLIALPLSLIAGIIATRIGFFVIFLAAAAGSLIGQLVFRAVGRRRGQWLPQLVGVIVVIGGIIPLLTIIFGSFSFSLGLVWAAIYVVMASGAAYYQMR